MIATDRKVVLDSALAWSSHDVKRVLALFTNDCVCEGVTFGVVARGKDELRPFVNGAFAAVPDLTFMQTSLFIAGPLASSGMDDVRHAKGRLPRTTRHRQSLFCDTSRHDHGAGRRQDPAQLRLLGCREVHEAGWPAHMMPIRGAQIGKHALRAAQRETEHPGHAGNERSIRVTTHHHRSERCRINVQS